MAGIDPGPLAAGVSVLLLAILESASFARRRDHPSSVAGKAPILGLQVRGLWPQVGRLNAVHFVNTSLAGTAFIVVILSNPSALKIPLGIVVFVAWLGLPVFELGQYEAFTSAEVTPFSLAWHLLAVPTLITTAFVSPYWLGGLFRVGSPTRVVSEAVDIANATNSTQIATSPVLDGEQTFWFAVLSLLVGVYLFVFLKLVEFELDAVALLENPRTRAYTPDAVVDAEWSRARRLWWRLCGPDTDES